jgi:FkbH-like protein
MTEELLANIEALRKRVAVLEDENRRLQRSVTVPEFPRVLGPRLEGLNTLWIGPCHIEGFSLFAERAGCRATHLLYSSFPHEEVLPFDAAPYDCIVVGLALRRLLMATGGEYAPDFPHLRPDWNVDNIDTFFANCHEEMVRQMNNIYTQCSGKPVFFVPFLEPSFNALGNLVRREGLLYIGHFVFRLNQGMAAHAASLASAYIIDINEMTNAVGRLHLQDDVINYYTHAVYIDDFDVGFDEKTGRIMPFVRPSDVFDSVNRWGMLNEVFWSRLLDNMKTLRSIDAVKLIIVDLDDTLWRGIAAEPLPDDIDNEEYFRTIGWPMAFAEALLYFKMRGGLIAICSKNDHDATVERFRKLWGNRIKLDDFCSVRINWDRKSENIASILKDVNLLPESVVFIDDNPREVDEVKREFPGIRVLGFQHYDWRRIILQAPETQVSSISQESGQRTDLIRAKVARDAGASSGASREEWLRSLEICVRFQHVGGQDDAGYNRAFELINKTNQFNTTGQRWTADQMHALFAQGGRLVALSVSDKHVDNGLVAVAVVRGDTIVQVVLSCRVFGLGVEDAFLYHIVQTIASEHSVIRAEEAETERNLVSREYFVRNGFVRDAKGAAVLEAVERIAMPAWITQV